MERKSNFLKNYSNRFLKLALWQKLLILFVSWKGVEIINGIITAKAMNSLCEKEAGVQVYQNVDVVNMNFKYHDNYDKTCSQFPNPLPSYCLYSIDEKLSWIDVRGSLSSESYWGKPFNDPIFLNSESPQGKGGLIKKQLYFNDEKGKVIFIWTRFYPNSPNVYNNIGFKLFRNKDDNCELNANAVYKYKVATDYLLQYHYNILFDK